MAQVLVSAAAMTTTTATATATATRRRVRRALSQQIDDLRDLVCDLDGFVESLAELLTELDEQSDRDLDVIEEALDIVGEVLPNVGDALEIGGAVEQIEDFFCLYPRTAEPRRVHLMSSRDSHGSALASLAR
jgi:hypothetical protein